MYSIIITKIIHSYDIDNDINVVMIIIDIRAKTSGIGVPNKTWEK